MGRLVGRMGGPTISSRPMRLRHRAPRGPPNTGP